MGVEATLGTIVALIVKLGSMEKGGLTLSSPMLGAIALSKEKLSESLHLLLTLLKSSPRLLQRTKTLLAHHSFHLYEMKSSRSRLKALEKCIDVLDDDCIDRIVNGSENHVVPGIDRWEIAAEHSSENVKLRLKEFVRLVDVSNSTRDVFVNWKILSGKRRLLLIKLKLIMKLVATKRIARSFRILSVNAAVSTAMEISLRQMRSYTVHKTGKTSKYSLPWES